MANEIAPTSDSALKKSLTRTQTIGIFGGFGAVLIILALFSWFHQSGHISEPAPKPIEMPAVIPQGQDEPSPPPQPTPSTHEEEVRQETLQALKDKASAAPIEN